MGQLWEDRGPAGTSTWVRVRARASGDQEDTLSVSSVLEEGIYLRMLYSPKSSRMEIK